MHILKYFLCKGHFLNANYNLALTSVDKLWEHGNTKNGPRSTGIAVRAETIG